MRSWRSVIGARVSGRAAFVAMSLVLTLPHSAARAQTWSYNIVTTGSDVEFVSPTAIDPGLPAYRLAYQVQQMLATAELIDFPGFPVEVDVTSELDPEFRSGVKLLAGPPPLELVHAEVQYPEDAAPNAAGFRSVIDMGLRADGRAFVRATNNVLSAFSAQFPPGSGVFLNIRLLSVRLIGTISAEPAGRVLGSPTTLIIPEGSARQLTVTLSQAPPGPLQVTVERVDGDPDFTVAGGALLSFTPQNWAAPRFATILAAVDADGIAGQATLRVSAPDYAPSTVTVIELEPDCNGNGVPDAAELASGSAPDCNGDRLIDTCEVAAGFVPDCNANGVPDACDLATGAASDCDNNGVPDVCDIGAGKLRDCDGNGIPDVCQPDRDGDGWIDACDGCPDDPNKHSPGLCGCGVVDTPACEGAARGGPDSPTTDAGTAPPDAPTSSSDSPGTDPGPAPAVGDLPSEDAALTAPLEALCGVGACGAPLLGWLPLTALALLTVKTRRLRC